MKKVAVLAAGLLAALLPRAAAAIDRDACAVPYEEAQVLRKKGLFSAATEQLERCRTRCPEVLAGDCKQWASELRTLTPTVVFQVHDKAGTSAGAFRVSIDGTLLTDTPDARAVSVDPGEHVFRFESPRFAPTEVRATLKEGEHRRIVDVTVSSVAPLPEAPLARRPDRPKGGAALSYALIGIGGGALAAGGALALVGFLDKSHLESACAPNCSEGSVATIRAVWISGGVLAGIGLASAVTGVLLWPKRSPSGQEGAWWAPTLGVGSLGVVGAF